MLIQKRIGIHIMISMYPLRDWVTCIDGKVIVNYIGSTSNSKKFGWKLIRFFIMIYKTIKTIIKQLFIYFFYIKYTFIIYL